MTTLAIGTPLPINLLAKQKLAVRVAPGAYAVVEVQSGLSGKEGEQYSITSTMWERSWDNPGTLMLTAYGAPLDYSLGSGGLGGLWNGLTPVQQAALQAIIDAGGTGGQIALRDEGVLLGNASTLNFVGNGVTATFNAGTGTITITGGGGGGDALTTSTLAQFAATTSAQLRSVINDETGTGSLVFSDSPALGGLPSAPTAALNTNTTQLATTAFVMAALNAITGGAPATLDAFNEFAAALGNDPNFASTITTALAGKQAGHVNLTALSGLVGQADRLPYFTGAGAMAMVGLTAFIRTLLDDADASTARGTLQARRALTFGANIAGNYTVTNADDEARRNVTANALISVDAGLGVYNLTLRNIGGVAITIGGSATLFGTLTSNTANDLITIVRMPGVDVYAVKVG